jgi:hypothetical protein
MPSREPGILPRSRECLGTQGENEAGMSRRAYSRVERCLAGGVRAAQDRLGWSSIPLVGKSLVSDEWGSTFRLPRIAWRAINVAVRQLFVRSGVSDVSRPIALSEAVRVHPTQDMTVTRYAAAGREALEFAFRGGDRLNVESYGDYFSVAWSTTLQLAPLLRGVERLMSADAQGDLTTVIGRTEEVSWSAPVVRSLIELEGSGEAVDFLRLDLDDHTLTWEARDPRPGQAGSGLFGLIADRYDADYLGRLMFLTATPPIGSHTGELLTRVAPLAEAVHIPLHANTR